MQQLYGMGLTAAKATARLRLLFGEKAPSTATVKRWFRRFRQGQASVLDRRKSGRKPKAGLEGMIAQELANGVGVSVRTIAQQAAVSESTVWRRLRSMGMRFKNARWTSPVQRKKPGPAAESGEG